MTRLFLEPLMLWIYIWQKKKFLRVRADDPRFDWSRRLAGFLQTAHDSSSDANFKEYVLDELSLVAVKYGLDPSVLGST